MLPPQSELSSRTLLFSQLLLYGSTSHLRPVGKTQWTPDKCCAHTFFALGFLYLKFHIKILESLGHDHEYRAISIVAVNLCIGNWDIVAPPVRSLIGPAKISVKQ